MPIGLTNIGWKMYMVNASWDIVIVGLIVGYPIIMSASSSPEMNPIYVDDDEDESEPSEFPDSSVARSNLSSSPASPAPSASSTPPGS